jgi:membrane-associated protease RseP (regulator of RpoE activity)
MKKMTTILAVLGIAGAAMAAGPSQQQQDNGQPQENQLQQQARPRRPENAYAQDYWRNIARHAEKGAYLGVSTAPVPQVLQRHLNLPAGMGLVVQFVAPKSPADEAGLQQDDILQKLDDQLLINAEQLAVLVRSYKPGDEIKLAIIRDGQKKTVTVKLAEHELEPLHPMPFEYWDMDRFQPRLQPPRTEVRPNPPANQRQNWSGPSSTLRWLEGDRNYTITITPQGHQSVTVKDGNDQTLFEGPIDTQEQRDRLPTDVKDKVEKMIKSNLLPPLEEPEKNAPAAKP